MANIGVEDLKKMKVNDLKKELKDRGLAVSGTKDVLMERLQEAVAGTPIPEEQSAVPLPAPAPADDTDSVEKSIDQLVGDTAPAEPVAPAPAAVTLPSKENIPKPDVEHSEEAKKVVSLKDVSEADRMKARAEKFGGAVSESAKKLMRAERFGVQESTTSSTDSIGTAPAASGDMDKLKKRAERFGMVVSNTLSKVDEDERKRKRLERFGAATATSTEAKKVKLNSTDSDLEERKKKRAERFGLT